MIPAPEGLTVRSARVDDAGTWLRMRVGLWPRENAQDLERDVQAYFEGGVQGLEEVLLAEQSGIPAGFAEMNIRPYAEGCVTDRVAYLEGWYVEPSHRRQGVGAALLRAAERWALSRGCTEFASDALVQNADSAAAHRAHGFEEVAVIRCFRKRIEGVGGEG